MRKYRDKRGSVGDDDRAGELRHTRQHAAVGIEQLRGRCSPIQRARERLKVPALKSKLSINQWHASVNCNVVI
jgi:hypothetical protein